MMKKILSLFAAMLFVGSMFAAEFTIASSSVVSGSGYNTYSATVDGRGWIITFGGNLASVGTNSTNRTKCTLSTYPQYAVSPVTASSIASAFVSTTRLSNINKVSYTFSGGSSQTSTNVYLIYSADNTTFSQIELTAGTQGATINAGTTYEFATCSGYFGLLFQSTNSSGNWRIDNVEVTFYEGEGGSVEPTPPSEGPLTCADAASRLLAGETFSGDITLEGYVTVMEEAYNSTFGNATFWIADEADGGQVLEVYRAKPATTADQSVKVSDKVTVTGSLVLYSGVPEYTTGATYTITEVGETVEPEEPSEPTAGTYDIVPNNAFWGTSFDGQLTGDLAKASYTGTKNFITIEYANGSNKYINDSQTRAYNGTTLTFSVPEGFNLTAISFTAEGSNWAGTHTANVGMMTDTKNWKGEANSVVITFGGICRITSISVTYAAVELDKPTITVNTQLLDFGNVLVGEDDTYVTDTTLEVTGANLTETIVATVSDHITITGDLTAEGGTLNLHIVAPLGVFSETVTLASGETSLEIAVAGRVYKPEMAEGIPVEMTTTGDSDANHDQNATVNGTAGIKAGTASAQGTIIVTIPANTIKLNFFAAAWTGEGGTMTISAPEGVTLSSNSVELKDDTGISGNANNYFLQTLTTEDCLFSLELTGVNEETQISFTRGTKNERFVIWGAAYELMPTYSILVEQQGEGTVTWIVNDDETGINPTELFEGDEVYVETTAAEGYRLTAFSVNNVESDIIYDEQGTALFLMPANDVTISATFSKLYKITVNVVGEEGGSVEYTPEDEALEGEDVMLLAEAFENYTLQSITISDNVADPEIDLEEGYATFNMPAGDVTITVTFMQEQEPVVGHAEYVLNGGFLADAPESNEALWVMFQPDYNEYYNLQRALRDITQVSTFASAVMQDFMTNEASAWKWLGDYVTPVSDEQGYVLDTEVKWRWTIHAFFNCSPASTLSVDVAGFTEAGKRENWVSAWSAAQLPATIETTYTLPILVVPTGYTFGGWYDNAGFTGDALLTIDENFNGTLYAKVTRDVETSVEAIAVELNLNAPIYNIMGQQVSADYKGIVIQNGNKFMLQ